MITRGDEEKFLKKKIADNDLFGGDFTFNDIVDATLNNKLVLEASKEYDVDIIDDDRIELIKNTIPFLMRISEKPRTHIQSLEMKVPVETAKCINQKAISRLAHNSNDWYARTIVTVKPKNICADVFEETLELYENRFICTLIERIHRLIRNARVDCEEAIQQLKNSILLDSMNNCLGLNDSISIYNKIVKKNKEIMFDDNQGLTFLKHRLDLLADIDRRIHILRGGDFYRKLRNKRKVRDPIQRTNILIFDQCYNKAFRLWKELNGNPEDEEIVDEFEDLPIEYLEKCYFLYCFLCLNIALHDMKFKENSKSKASFGEQGLSLKGDFVFERDFDESTIKCSILNDCIILKHRVSENPDEWEEYRICPNYQDFDVFDVSDVDEFTRNLLNDMTEIEVIKNRQIRRQNHFAALSIDFFRYTLQNNSLPEKLCRRFYSLGENFSNEEDQSELKRWASYKTGILIISPEHLKESLLKIERILNFIIVKNSFHKDIPVRCPVCGGNNFKPYRNDKDRYCSDCKRLFSFTNCSNCNNEIRWIKYVDDSFLNREDIRKHLDMESPSFNRLRTVELIMRECTATAFDIEKEKEIYKLKTICPHCGVSLGKKY